MSGSTVVTDVLVVALDTGGRWSRETVNCVERLAVARRQGCTTESATFGFSRLEAAPDPHGRHLMKKIVC